MRLLADSSAWIDLFRGSNTSRHSALRSAILDHTVLLGDLIQVEVLRGVSDERQARDIEAHFRKFEIVSLCGAEIAIEAARNYRNLRSKGVTVRGTIDLIIGTWCIENNVPLLSWDRDFVGMERYLGLDRWVA